TDARLIELGLTARLGLGAPATFSETETNPTEANLQAGLCCYRERNCDGIIAFGGGAALDLAKLVGQARILARVPPIVAIPTTAGSGSEVGRAALLKLDCGKKLGFLSAHLLPRAAVCDPELTLSLPPALTAATGMDAISHCVEAYCSSRVNAVADAIALDGLGRGWRAIRGAFADGADRAAREQMMLCALM